MMLPLIASPNPLGTVSATLPDPSGQDWLYSPFTGPITCTHVHHRLLTVPCFIVGCDHFLGTACFNRNRNREHCQWTRSMRAMHQTMQTRSSYRLTAYAQARSHFVKFKNLYIKLRDKTTRASSGKAGRWSTRERKRERTGGCDDAR